MNQDPLHPGAKIVPMFGKQPVTLFNNKGRRLPKETISQIDKKVAVLGTDSSGPNAYKRLVELLISKGVSYDEAIRHYPLTRNQKQQLLRCFPPREREQYRKAKKKNPSARRISFQKPTRRHRPIRKAS